MAPDTDNSIEALLEQRSQYEQWLAKLDSAANKAPDAVRKKVRADYEVRLRGVIERLRGHSATIAEELQRHQGSQRELDAHRREAEEGEVRRRGNRLPGGCRSPTFQTRAPDRGQTRGDQHEH